MTYAISKLNTWVLTEMWFIIIFGSIPTLRPFFVRFTQDLKSATGYSSRDRGNTPGYIDESRSQRESWIQLGDRAPPTDRARVSRYPIDIESGQSMGERSSSEQDLVTKDRVLVSEQSQHRRDGF